MTPGADSTPLFTSTICAPVPARAEAYTLTLKQALERGLSRNPDLTLATLDAMRAAQAVPLAKDPFTPHVYAGSGLAYRIAESGYRLNIPRMFAALLLLSAAGIVIYGLLALTSHLVLRRWHESALGKENG